MTDKLTPTPRMADTARHARAYIHADLEYYITELERELAALRGKVVEEWIAVGDRLPDVGVECLVWSKQPWQKEFSIKFDTWQEQHEAPLEWSSATIPIGLGWDDHDDFESVTHWQPLPEPPSGKSEVSVSSQPK